MNDLAVELGSVEKVIHHEGSKWILYSHDGSKKLGEFDTEEAALKRERQINYFKHVTKSDLEMEFGKSNTCHVPSGPKGGQFCELKGGTSGSTFASGWQKSLSGAEGAEVKRFSTSNGYMEINNVLRFGKAGDLEYYRNRISRLDSAVGKAKLPADTVVYRGVTGGAAAKLLKSKAGARFSDRGFVSVSSDRGTAVRYADSEGGKEGTVVRLRLKAGSTAAPIYAVSKYPEEKEFLLPRNSKFRVVGTTKLGTRTFVDVEVV